MGKNIKVEQFIENLHYQKVVGPSVVKEDEYDV